MPTGGKRDVYLLHSNLHDRLTVFSSLNAATRDTRFKLRMPHDPREVPGLSRLELVHMDHPKAVIAIDLLAAPSVHMVAINRSTALLPAMAYDGLSVSGYIPAPHR